MAQQAMKLRPSTIRYILLALVAMAFVMQIITAIHMEDHESSSSENEFVESEEQHDQVRNQLDMLRSGKVGKAIKLEDPSANCPVKKCASAPYRCVLAFPLLPLLSFAPRLALDSPPPLPWRPSGVPAALLWAIQKTNSAATAALPASL